MESTRKLQPWLDRLTPGDCARWLAGGVATACALLFCQRLYASGQLLFAALALLTLAAVLIVMSLPALRVWRFVLPGILASLVFLILPIAYTLRISFTNFSFGHMLSFERATDYFFDLSYQPEEGESYRFTLLQDRGRYRIETEGEDGERLCSAPFTLPSPMRPLQIDVEPISRPEGLKVVEAQSLIAHLDALKALRLRLPRGQILRLSGLGRFDVAQPQYSRAAGGLRNERTEELLRPNFTTGFYEDADGKPVSPGFKVDVGWQEYRELLFGPTLSGPIMQIFIWNTCFAALSVALGFALGFALAILLSWEGLAGRTLLKTLFFLPSAIPLVVGAEIVRGLFDHQTGEINMLLNMVFGIRLDWFNEPGWARLMILLVSAWTGFSYFMMICLAMIKAIPSNLYEVSALAGAGPLDNLRYITWPMIRRPMLPLFVASFAFNFNNAALVRLLTNGGPAFPDSQVGAGMTDLLVSFTYAQTIRNGANFGIGAALSVLLFLIVGALAWVSLRITENIGRRAA